MMVVFLALVHGDYGDHGDSFVRAERLLAMFHNVDLSSRLVVQARQVSYRLICAIVFTALASAALSHDS